MTATQISNLWFWTFSSNVRRGTAISEEKFIFRFCQITTPSFCEGEIYLLLIPIPNFRKVTNHHSKIINFIWFFLSSYGLGVTFYSFYSFSNLAELCNKEFSTSRLRIAHWKRFTSLNIVKMLHVMTEYTTHYIRTSDQRVCQMISTCTPIRKILW